MDPIPVDYKFLAFGTLIALFIISFSLVAKKSSKKKTPPEPRGAWPLLGHYLMLTGSQPRYVTLGALADKYGPIFTVRIGLRRAVVVSDSEVAKEIFAANDKAVSSRPPMAAWKYLTYNYAMFPFTPESGSYWREMRGFAASELLSSRRLEQSTELKLREIRNCLRQLFHNHQTGHALVDVKQLFGDLNLNVMLRLVSGRDFLGEGAAGEEKGRQLQKATNDLFRCWGLLLLEDAVPFLGRLGMGGHRKEIERVAKDIDEFAEEWLREPRRRRRREEHRTGEGKQGQADFVDAVISFLNGKGRGGYDPDTIAKALSMSIMTAGNESTTVVMTWAIAVLLNHPEVLKKAQQELDTLVGKHRLVRDTDIPNLVYLQAFVKETLRLYPPAATSIRPFEQDCTIKGYFIPKGTWLMTLLLKIQTDPRVWQDPLEFKPERFLTTHKQVDFRSLNHDLTPFGSGRRSCPAMPFALQMLHLTLASLLHAFDLSTPGHALVDMTRSGGLTAGKATPLQVLVSPRLSPECFE